MDDSDTLAQLFAAPLEAFIATRDRLAAELARQGKKDESRALKKVRRPSPSAWATNQVVAVSRPAVDAFLDASDELRVRQGALLSGRGDQTAYQAGVEGLRRATAALAAAARDVLTGAGRGDDRRLVDAVVANVRAAALADARRPELLAGRLTVDLEAGDEGLGGLLGAGLASPGAGRPTLRSVPMPPPADEGAGKAERERTAREAARRQQDEARARALADARREEAAAGQAAARAEAAARDASARRERARAALAEAEQALASARDELRESEAEQRHAAAEQARADGAARAATRRRETLEKA